MCHAKEKDHASQEDTHKVEEDTAKLARQRVAAEEAIADADVVAEVGSAQAEEATIDEVTVVEVVAPHTATDRTAAEEVAVAEAPSDQAGQGEPRGTTDEVMEETLAGMGALGPEKIAAQASSDIATERGMGTDTPMPKKEVDEVADPPHAEADAGPGNLSQETPAAQTEEVDRGEASITPGAATKSSLGWRTFTAPAGTSVGSQSSASRLQKEWRT
jgi:hypothetical protein